MPRLANEEYKQYGKDFTLTDKALERLTKCIKDSKVDVYDDDYDLFPITEKLLRLCPVKSTREACRLDGTLEIIKSIEYMKDNNLI